MTPASFEGTAAALVEAEALVAARAQALDEGRTDVRTDLAALGESGLFDSALKEDGLPTLVEVIEAIAAQSLTVGFSVWAHVMTLRCVLCAPVAIREQHAEALRTGERPGVTAMSASIKHLAGLGQVPLTAEKFEAGRRISGPIAWASNVFDDALIVLPARGDAGDTCVALVAASAPGVTIGTYPNLMALGGTASTSLHLDRVEVPAAQIISTDLPKFLSRMRFPLLLLQTALCVGVGRAALAGAVRASGPRTTPFAVKQDALSESVATLRNRLYEFAAAPPCHPAQIARLRLDATTTAVAATRLELALVGGSAYVREASTNRRFREAAFLPILSPTEGQLRTELQ